eukprot:5866750-Lingulodinium_polyedra.AAC.1
MTAGLPNLRESLHPGIKYHASMHRFHPSMHPHACMLICIYNCMCACMHASAFAQMRQDVFAQGPVGAYVPGDSASVGSMRAKSVNAERFWRDV